MGKYGGGLGIYTSNFTGCFTYKRTARSDGYASGGADNLTQGINLNASWSSSLYGKSTTIQPNATQILIIIKT